MITIKRLASDPCGSSVALRIGTTGDPGFTTHNPGLSMKYRKECELAVLMKDTRLPFLCQEAGALEIVRG